jgi:hypothetical protein
VKLLRLPHDYYMVAVARNISTDYAINIIRAWALDISGETLTISDALPVIARQVRFVVDIASQITRRSEIRENRGDNSESL